MADPDDVLVLLTDDVRAASTAEDIAARHHVLQRSSARVFTIERPAPPAADALRSTAGVLVLPGDPAPDLDRLALDDGERLFVRAWLQRHRDEQPVRRRGEGRAWDDPEFEPPDLPQ